MCGICGIVSFEASAPVRQGVLEKMTGLLRHRGPDDEGFYLDDQVGFGARRLSIIDLEGGRQPIHNEDQTIWLVFNGEIYNFRTLRRLLEKSGHRFLTNSDTEVILHSYEEFGDDVVNYLNGMFAFAIWDKNRHRLLMARDRLGIKPLFYCLANRQLTFGSEIKAVLADPAVKRQLDLIALNEYLSFEYVPTPRTIFQEIKQLPPGHVFIMDSLQTRTRQYWDTHLEQSEGTSSLTEAEYVLKTREALAEAISKEMVADVPVGILLSGGIDSSAVAALASQLTEGKLKTFSIAFEDPSFDESPWARLVSDHLATEHYEEVLSPQMLPDLMSEIVEFMDEPLGDSSIIPTYLVCRLASQHVKAVLSGDGGDELFGGYSTLQAHKVAHFYDRAVPSALRNRLIPWIVQRLPVSSDNISFDFKARRFVSGRGEPAVVRHHIWLGSFTDSRKKLLLQPWAQVPDCDTYEVAIQHLRACQAQQSMNQVLYCDMKLYLEGDILPKVDRASMANSLEVRVPFLNNALVSLAEGIPHSYKLRRLTTKYVLRQAIKGLVPPAILRRGKKGFNIPVARWLQGPLKPVAEEMFSESRLQDQGLFVPSYVKALWDEHLLGFHDHRKLLWTLLAFQLWYHRWFKS